MASAWLWVLAYVLVFCCFQLLLYRYLQGKEGATLEQAAPGSGDGESAARPTSQASVDVEDGEGVRCRRCGAYNDSDSTYTYCQECVEPLQ